jgi:MFS family permease
VRIFSNRPFLVENIILGIVMMVFIPVFFFASTYGQIALGEKATTASLLILYFFLGFVVFAQIGGRMLDRIGAKRPVVLGGPPGSPTARPPASPRRSATTAPASGSPSWARS